MDNGKWLAKLAAYFANYACSGIIVSLGLRFHDSLLIDLQQRTVHGAAIMVVTARAL